MIYFQDLTKRELAEHLLPLSPKNSRENDEKVLLKRAQLRARQIFHWVYQRGATEWEQLSDISKEVREWLKTNVILYRPEQAVNQQAMDGTHKFLWKLEDAKTVESVVIPASSRVKGSGLAGLDPEEEDDTDAGSVPYIPEFAGTQSDADLNSTHWTRLTLCISSQVGCAMGCKFCLTGIQGLDRHLKTYEIVAQVLELRRMAPITNIVFMGMGEPLHNFENVVKACEIILDQDGMGFSKRKVTISTSGLVPAIRELGKRIDVSLAISLNSSCDEQRDSLMPVNKRFKIAELLQACREYPTSKFRRITYEYVMIKGFNDSIEDAVRVAKLLDPKKSKVNLIPMNEHPGSPYLRPSDETVYAFQRYLIKKNFTATVRISRGRDILAACGQLRSLFGTARGTEKHKDFKEQTLN